MRTHTPRETQPAPPVATRPSRTLQRKCACGGTPGPSGECAACRRKRLARKRLARKRLQASLAVGPAHDRFEREADRVAGSVARAPAEAAPLRAPLAVQRVGSGAHGGGGGMAAPASVDAALALPGRPLDAETRRFMEARMGHDFSAVRVHTGARAAASAREVNARAYTVGSNVAFGAGEYRPGTAEGRRLLAHELVHTLQQGGAGARVQRLVTDESLWHMANPTATPTTSATPAATKTCAATYTIPNDVHKAVEDAWAKSGHGGATVAEHGGRIVTDSAGKRVIRTGSGGSGSISLPAEKPGDTTTGTFHTHPYSKSEGSTLGVSFSGGDLNNFIQGGQGSVKYVGAGTCIFTATTLDQPARDACKTKDIKKRWNDAFSKAGGTFQEKVHAAVKAAITGCGICYYQACRPDTTSPIPKSSKLVP